MFHTTHEIENVRDECQTVGRDPGRENHLKGTTAPPKQGTQESSLTFIGNPEQRLKLITRKVVGEVEREQNALVVV